MPPLSYPIDTRPCIPVRCGTRTDYVGLRRLLVNAHYIDDLAIPLAPAQSTLYRFLTAIVASITGLNDPEMPLQTWLEHRADWLTRKGGFPIGQVHAYFDTDGYVFDLFHQRQPWMQDRALATQSPKRSGINALVYGRPAGRNLAWFNGTHTDTAPKPLPTREALWHLLAHHYYGPSGRCPTRKIGSLNSGQVQAGPLRSTVSFHPHGRTLYETLLLHQIPYRGDDQNPDADACPWEEPHPPDPSTVPPQVTWPKRLLTGRSVHAVLLIPDADGEYVTDAHLTWATQHPKLEATDPYLIYDLDLEAPAERRRSPRRADADRAVWRDLDALLLAGDEHRPGCRPEAFTTLNSLPEAVRANVRVWVCGFDQDGKVKNRIWYTALTPPIWMWAQEHDAAKAARIVECRSAAESLAGTLHKQADRAWKETTGRKPGRGDKHGNLWPRQALAAYWPRAERAFWQLIDDERPAHGVFAAEAIHALHQATAPAVNYFRAAGPALARATQALRMAGAPPNDTRKTGATRAQP
ncbi:type I-E CRISPR-associated protein Cse1/CasA [Streptomyces sp. NPDC001640]